MLQQRRGFLFVGALFVLIGLLTVTVAGLGRSLTDLNAATRVVTTSQAFQRAEAGVDEVLTTPATLNSANPSLAGKTTYTTAEVNALLRGPDNDCGETDASKAADNGQLTPPPGANYTLTVIDNVNPATCTDTDHLVTLLADGGANQRLRVTLELPGVTNPWPFDYSVAASDIELQGNATLGSMDARAPIYVEFGPLEVTSNQSKVWASKVDFRPNGPLATLCPDCQDPGVFPVSPPPAPTFNTGVPSLRYIILDFKPYYEAAISQQAIDGKSYHHIRTDTTLNGNNYSGCLEGVIYVETGVHLTLSNDLCIHGTIVHEGTAGYGPVGSIESGPNLALTIDSLSSTDINQDGTPEPPVAPGMAVFGAGVFDFANNSQFGDGSQANPGIKGFMMTGSRQWDAGRARVASLGTIQGGLIAVLSDPRYCGSPTCSGSGHPYLALDIDGPVDTAGNYGPPFTVQLIAGLLIGGSANIVFTPLDSTPFGLQQPGSNVDRPTIRSWSVD